MNNGNSSWISPLGAVAYANWQVFALLFFFSSFSSPLFAQPAIEWDRDFGGTSYEEVRGLQQTSDGGYIMGAHTSSDAGGDVTDPAYASGWSDFWLVKIDPAGNKVWDRRFGGTAAESLQDVKETSDGGFILGGWSYSDISGDKTENNYGFPWTSDIWIVKTDSNGNFQWDLTLGGSNNEQLYGVEQTSDGGYIIGGWSDSGISGTKSEPSQGGWDFWMVKVDASGNYVWDKTFGGTAFDMMLDIHQTTDGGYILGGWSGSDANGDKSDPLIGVIDFWVIKTDGAGNKVWDQTYGGNGNDQIRRIQQTNDGGYVFAGFSDSDVGGYKSEPNQGDLDMWIVRTNAAGTYQWDKTFGGAGYDELQCIEETPHGILLLGGYSNSGISGDKTEASRGSYDYWVIKANSVGTKIWDKTLGGSDSDILSRFYQTMDGGYVLSGWSNSDASGEKSEDTNGSNDAWVVKLLCDIEIDAGADQVICENETASFDLSDPYCFDCTYLWDDGNTQVSRTVSPTTSTNYQVTLTNSFGCTLTDEVLVTVNESPIVDLGIDTVLCDGESIIIDGGSNPGATYLWSTGASTQSITATTTGTYSVTVTNPNTCTATDSRNVVVVAPPTVNLGNNVSICEGESIALNAGNPGYFYSWSTGEMSQMIIVDTSGTYSVTVTDAAGCEETDAVTITVNPAPTAMLLGDTIICNGETVPLTFSLSGNGPFDVVYHDGTNHTLNNINDGHTIDVSPSSTTTYTLISVHDDNSPSCTASSLNSVTVTVNFPTTTNTTAEICDGDSILLGGDYRFTNGLYQDVLQTEAGCDSLVLTTLTVNPVHIIPINLASCNPLDTGLVIYNLTNQYGCDSIIYETTSLLPSDTLYTASGKL